MERSVLILRDFLHLSVEFRSGCLVDAAGLFEMVCPHCFQHAEYSCCIDICCEFWRVEADLNVALGCEVIDFIRLHRTDHLHERH